jgi:hypothetical protein
MLKATAKPYRHAHLQAQSRDLSTSPHPQGARAWSCLLGALALSQAVAGACDVTLAQQQVRAVEERWLAHVGEPEVVGPLLAEDFVHVLPRGLIDKHAHLQYLRDHPNAFPGAKHFAALRIRIYGKTAVATGIVSSQHDRAAANQLTAFTDVFVLRQGHWQAVSAQELPLADASPQAH